MKIYGASTASLRKSECSTYSKYAFRFAFAKLLVSASSIFKSAGSRGISFVAAHKLILNVSEAARMSLVSCSNEFRRKAKLAGKNVHGCTFLPCLRLICARASYLYRLFAKGDLCKYAAHLLRCTPKINAQRTKSTSAFYFRLSPCICIASLQRLTERLFFLNKPGKCIRQCFSYRKIVRLELHLNRVAVKLWRNSLTILRGYTP